MTATMNRDTDAIPETSAAALPSQAIDQVDGICNSTIHNTDMTKAMVSQGYMSSIIGAHVKGRVMDVILVPVATTTISQKLNENFTPAFKGLDIVHNAQNHNDQGAKNQAQGFGLGKKE